MRLSYSALETFKRCPLKFKLQYIDKIKTPKSSEAIFGTLIHNALKLLHEPSFSIPSEEDILKYITDNWDASVYQSEQESAIAFAQAIKIIKDYYAKNYPGQFNVVALEMPFEAPIKTQDETHIITGKIDRIDKTPEGLFEVIDYKTAKKMPPQEKAEKDLQLSVYHLGLVNQWPSILEEQRPVKVSLYYLKHGEKISSCRLPKEIDLTKENIIKIIEKVTQAQQQEKFNATPNALCDWCKYQRYCPYFKHKFKEEKLFFNDQDIKELINRYTSLKEQIDKNKKELEEIKNSLGKFMDQEGLERLFGKDGYLTRQVIQTFSYEPDLLKKILEPLGKWNEILKIDETKLKKILKTLPKEINEEITKSKKMVKEYKKIDLKKTKKKSL